MLEGIAEDNQLPTGPGVWLARLGRIFWGLIEVSVPRSLPSLVFKHWLKLVYLFEVLLITAGVLFPQSDAQRLGLTALVVTLVVHLATFFIADLVRGRQRWALLARALAATAVALVVAIAFYFAAIQLSGAIDKMPVLSLQLDSRFFAALAGAIALVMTISAPLLLALDRVVGSNERLRLPQGVKLPGIALELASGPADVVAIAGPPDSPLRDRLRMQTDLDFLVIAFYWLLLLAVSGLCAALSSEGSWLGAVAAVSVTAAALFDVLENFRIYALLDARTDVGARLGAMREATRLKWGALFITMALLGASMLWRGSQPLRLLGGWFALTAGVGGIGVVRRNRTIQTAFFMMLAAFAGIAVLGLWPQVFLPALR
jgi:hypothetical protein